MSLANPIPRSARQGDVVTATAGQSEFTVSAFRIWDVADVEIWKQPAAGGAWARLASGFTVTKTSGEVFDTFTVTLATGAALNDKFYFAGARVHERQSDVTAGGTISSAALEREFDRLATLAQEARRDLDKRPAFEPEGNRLPVNGARVSGMANAVDENDAVTKAQVGALIEAYVAEEVLPGGGVTFPIDLGTFN